MIRFDLEFSFFKNFSCEEINRFFNIFIISFKGRVGYGGKLRLV